MFHLSGKANTSNTEWAGENRVKEIGQILTPSFIVVADPQKQDYYGEIPRAKKEQRIGMDDTHEDVIEFSLRAA